jgi:hypothetical protein
MAFHHTPLVARDACLEATHVDEYRAILPNEAKGCALQLADPLTAEKRSARILIV